MLETVIYHGQKTELRGRAGREKEQQIYKSDQVSQSRQQEEEYKMSAVKVEAEGTGRAAKLAVGCRGFQQKIIFKTTNQFRHCHKTLPVQRVTQPSKHGWRMTSSLKLQL